MISVDEAIKTILKHLPPKRLEKKTLMESVGYTIAENVYSDIDLPPFDKSAMDGFAVRAEDINRPPVELELIETVSAGETAIKSVKPGKTIKIMTGAPVPAGADTVVMKETTNQTDNLVRFNETIKYGANICYQGEDLKKGEKVLSAGTLIRPPEIGLLASVGQTHLKVFRKPSVSILTTGDELVEIDQKPKKAQIRNSNSYFLMTQMRQFGLAPVNLGIARDKPEHLARKIRKGLRSDIFILTGGVSAGDYDLVEPLLVKAGVKILFNMVAIKPGKPFVLGVKKGQKNPSLVFALPGNPVSAFVITEVFIRPAIAELTANPSLKPRIVQANIGENIRLKTSDRQQYIPARYDKANGLVSPVTWHGSADIVGLTRANSLIIVPPNTLPGPVSYEVMLLT